MDSLEKVTPVTQRLIAEKVGVSQRLVAYALNGNGRMGEETRKKVLEEAKRLGYRPNRAAQALVTGHSSSMVALCVPHLSTAFCNEVVQVVERQARARSVGLIVAGMEETEEGAWNSSPLAHWPVDGALILDPRKLTSPPGVPTTLKLVFMGVSFVPDQSSPYDFVHIDITEAVEDAIKHLKSIGSKRIAYMATVSMMRSTEVRYATYIEQMKAIGQEPEFIVIPNTEKPRPEAAAILQSYIEAHGHPDALLCGNDEIAMGAYRALRKLGLSIPKDVAIIGCDGIQDTEDLSPTLTTLSLPIEEMGERTWHLLMQRLQNPDSPPQHISMRADLIVRESTRELEKPPTLKPR